MLKTERQIMSNLKKRSKYFKRKYRKSRTADSVFEQVIPANTISSSYSRDHKDMLYELNDSRTTQARQAFMSFYEPRERQSHIVKTTNLLDYEYKMPDLNPENFLLDGWDIHYEPDEMYCGEFFGSDIGLHNNGRVVYITVESEVITTIDSISFLEEIIDMPFEWITEWMYDNYISPCKSKEEFFMLIKKHEETIENYMLDKIYLAGYKYVVNRLDD